MFVGEATRRTTEQTIVYAGRRLVRAQGQGGPDAALAAQRVVSGLRGSLKSHGPRGAVRRPRPRAAPDQGALPHLAAEERKAHLVSVTGIAGIGKSRLGVGVLQVLRRHRRDRRTGTGAAASSYGEGVTYWALADMVRMRCRIAEDEEPASALAKLQRDARGAHPRRRGARASSSRGSPICSAWPSTRPATSRISSPPGGCSSSASPTTYPTVLAFEDMQWADESLLDFVEYLLEWSRNSPIFVITLARPELLERRPTWGAGQRNFTSLYLEPLSPQAMEELLAGLVPGLPAEVRDAILARAEGVPLYAVETVRMLLDRGCSSRTGRSTGPSASRGARGARDAACPDRRPARRALGRGAAPAPGRGRPREDVHAGRARGARRRRRDIEPLLAALVRKEVLGVQADPRSPEHGQYGFLQDLVRHVAYETLSQARAPGAASRRRRAPDARRSPRTRTRSSR